jgi:hypothetical protein
MIFSNLPIILRQVSQESLLIFFEVLFIAIKILMFLQQIIMLELGHLFFMVPNIELKVHLRFIEGFELLLLSLVGMEGLLVFHPLLVGVVESYHVPHSHVRLLPGATDGLTFNRLVDIILVGW